MSHLASFPSWKQWGHRVMSAGDRDTHVRCTGQLPLPSPSEAVNHTPRSCGARAGRPEAGGDARKPRRDGGPRGRNVGLTRVRQSQGSPLSTRFRGLLGGWASPCQRASPASWVGVLRPLSPPVPSLPAPMQPVKYASLLHGPTRVTHPPEGFEPACSLMKPKSASLGHGGPESSPRAPRMGIAAWVPSTCTPNA